MKYWSKLSDLTSWCATCFMTARSCCQWVRWRLTSVQTVSLLNLVCGWILKQAHRRQWKFAKKIIKYFSVGESYGRQNRVKGIEGRVFNGCSVFLREVVNREKKKHTCTHKQEREKRKWLVTRFTNIKLFQFYMQLSMIFSKFRFAYAAPWIG